jgi:multidrug efflux pump subunit AcrA (membrane-fusion protein)
MPSRRPGRGGKRARRWAAAAAGGAVALVAVSAAYAASGSSGPAYRTAPVSRGPVEQTLDVTGTISPVSQAALVFPVSGRVTSVAVTAGQHVSAGQVLARLDTSTLLVQVSQDQAAVAAAQAKLASDQNSQTAGTTGTTGTTSTASVTGIRVSAGGAVQPVDDPALAAAATEAEPHTAVPVAFTNPVVAPRGRSGAGTSGGGEAAALQHEVAQQQARLIGDVHAADELLLQTQAQLSAARATCGRLLSLPGGRGGSTAAASSYNGLRDQGFTAVERAALSTGSGSPGPSRVPTPTISAATPTPTTSAAPTPTTAARPPAPSTGGSPPSTAKARACAAALSTVLDEQTRLSADQKTVAADESSLAGVLAQLARVPPSSPPTSGKTPPTSGKAPSTSGKTPSTAGGRTATAPAGRTGPATSSRSGTGTRTSGGSSTSARSGTSGVSGTSAGGRAGAPATPLATPQQLAADQAGIDAANAQLAQARQAVQQAQLLSPIAGTVATVNLTVGQNVSGASTDTQLLIVGPGSFEVATAVPDTSVGQVKVADVVRVTPDGVNRALGGRVVAVGSLPTATAGTSGSSASASYPVTVAFDGTPTGLFAGADADVSILLAEARGALSVPSSAVRTVGGFHLVTVVAKGKATSARVTVGAVGPALTQITSGLAAGQRVVLADLHQPLPTNTTGGRGRGLGLGGGGSGSGGGVRGGTGTGGTGAGGTGPGGR